MTVEVQQGAYTGEDDIVRLEDVLTLAKGVPVEHNEQLVSRVVRLGDVVQRTAMKPAEARELLQTRRPGPR